MNTSALAYTQGYELKELLKKQISSPVRWREIQERLVEYSCDTFIEIGPGKVLKGLADRSVPSVKTYLTGTFEALSTFLKNDAPCLACAIP
jgi:[acyl-carrier-protein] S-malonyltransferase